MTIDLRFVFSLIYSSVIYNKSLSRRWLNDDSISSWKRWLPARKNYWWNFLGKPQSTWHDGIQPTSLCDSDEVIPNCRNEDGNTHDAIQIITHKIDNSLSTNTCETIHFLHSLICSFFTRKVCEKCVYFLSFETAYSSHCSVQQCHKKTF